MPDTLRDLLYNRQNTTASELSYEDVLRDAREHISRTHANELALCIAERDSAERVRNLIADFLAKHYIRLTGLDIEDLTQRLYLDMAGFGFLEQYIYDTPSKKSTVIAGMTSRSSRKQGTARYPRRYLTEQAMDMVKNGAPGRSDHRQHQPAVDSYLTPRIRISAMIPPIVDPERAWCSV